MKSRLVSAAKYLGHGVLFSILVYAVEYLWVYVLIFLAGVGALLGLLLAFALLMIAFGFINSLITRLLWFPVRGGWKTYLGQGLALFLTLFFIEFLPTYLVIPLLSALSLAESVATLVLLNVAYAFIDGYVGKSIGGHWKVRGVLARVLAGKNPVAPAPEIKPDNPDAVCCPSCGGTKLVVASDHSAYCIDCRKGILRDVAGRFSG